MNKPKKIIVAALALASFCVTSGVEAAAVSGNRVGIGDESWRAGPAGNSG